jgi:hypothetical protein
VSVTWIVKVNVPVAVEVPVISPVAAFKLRPPGRLPVETLQVRVRTLRALTLA